MKIFVRYFFLVTLFFSLIVFISAFYFTPTLSRFSSKVEVYTDSSGSDANIRFYTKGDNPFFAKITGESCVIDNLSLKQLLDYLDAKIYHTERIDGKLCIYGYSKKLPYKKQAFNQVINFQIVILDNALKLGTPVIYGGY